MCYNYYSNELPSSIGNLVHLRFLSVKDSVIRRFSSCVANLMCMQTLDLHAKVRMTVSNMFKNMKQLRHLYLPWNHRVSGEKLSLATLCNLQTLVNLYSEDSDLNDVELSNLTKLYIVAPKGSKHLEKLDEMLKSRSITFNHLRSLYLLEDHSGGDIIVLRFPFISKLRLFGLTRLPEELLRYPNLVKIKLYNTYLEEDQIEVLEKLPELRVLHLEFGCLKELKEWTMEEGAMPRLCRLNIDHCQGLRALPDGLQYSTTLKELVLKQMPIELCSRLDEEGEDFYKIKHVPSVIITERQFIWELNHGM
ncbi:putative leucine-rich repeat domain, L domain-containing protein [Rosa chinensis]|uniref:Putative leucine-rich repeat domain, L domain-containing protein n=1 Tax=Rosa chinensis TaxID=74649 RepID=A0A2P6SHZ2_ROSCH|nr:putative leucine-rich repeat domain, L domain-containing protein [Rosa chinensis]